jgi:hypothetical protein
MAFAQPESLDSTVLSSYPRPAFGRDFKPIEAEELRWRTGPGPGYDRARAEEYLRNRYEQTPRAIRLTLPKILSDDRCKHIIAQLKNDGLLDWQILVILASIVALYQIEQTSGGSRFPPDIQDKLIERIHREEREDDPQFDLGRLTVEVAGIQRCLLSAAAFKTWDLKCHRAHTKTHFQVLRSLPRSVRK